MPVPTGGSRAQPRDIVELRRLAERQPELAPAAALQIELIDVARRVSGRLSTPWIEASQEDLLARLTQGRALLDLAQIAFEWNDVRLLVRQVTDILRRHGAMDDAAAAAMHDIGRRGDLATVVSEWFAGREPDPPIDMLSEVLTWATRPYIQRSAEAIQQRVSLDRWGYATCPVCAAEPEFSVLQADGGRRLVCGRCHVRWSFDATRCPFCGNHDARTLTSFSSADGLYRVTACGVCRRYLKAFDSRHATRPMLPLVDPIATLSLDAAVMQRGYTADRS